MKIIDEYGQARAVNVDKIHGEIIVEALNRYRYTGFKLVEDDYMNKERKISMTNMRRLREAKSLTQADVAKLLNVDQSTVAKWETSESMPRAEKLPELAKILGCTIEELLEAEPTARMRTEPEPIDKVQSLERENKELITKIERLTHEYRKLRAKIENQNFRIISRNEAISIISEDSGADVLQIDLSEYELRNTENLTIRELVESDNVFYVQKKG